MNLASHFPYRAYCTIALALAVCAILYGIDLACLTCMPAQGRIIAANIAVPFDLMVCVPVAFYLLALRRLHVSPLFVLPVIYCGAFVSSLLVQIGDFSLLELLLPATAIVDVIVAAAETRRFVRVLKSARSKSNCPLIWFEETIDVFLPNRRAAHMLSLELTMWYCTLACWKKKPDIPYGSIAFSYHRDSGFLALFGVLIAIMPIEIFVVHLLIMRWSWVAATVITVLSAYMLVWMIGSMRAVVLNPILIDDKALTIRWGSYFSERIPLDSIEGVENAQPDVPKKERLEMGMMGANPCWVVLCKPIPMQNILGTTRLIRAINITPDNVGEFKKILLAKHSDKKAGKGKPCA